MYFLNLYNRIMKAISEVRYQHDEEVLEPLCLEETMLPSVMFVREPSDRFGPRPAYRHHSGPCRPSTKEGTLVPVGHCAICGRILKH